MKKIKEYFSLQRRIQIEILETLCSICKYISLDAGFSKNPYGRYFCSHFTELKLLSEILREKERKGR